MSVPATQQSQSLFGQMAKLTPAGGSIVKVETQESGVPFVGFVAEKSKRYADLIQAFGKVPIGTPFYYSPSLGYVKLDPFKFHLLQAEQFWVQRNSDDVAISVTKTPQTDFKSPLKENIESVLLVYIGDKILPAACSFRGALAKIAQNATRELEMSVTPEWVKRNKDHEFAATIPQPQLRFTVTATVRQDTAKTSGFKYAKGTGASSPTTAAQVKMLADLPAVKDFDSQIQAVRQAFASRVEALNKLAGGAK